MPDRTADRTPPRRPNPNDWRAAAAPKGGGRGLVVGTLFALLAVGGAIVGMLVFWPKAPAEPLLVAVPVGEYQNPGWPPNPWADRDADVLLGCFPDRASKAFEFQQRDRFRLLLDRVAGKVAADPGITRADLSAKPLVLHVTALAAVRDGTVYLLPGDARPADPASWVAVGDVLDAVAASAAPHKLLVLDLAHPLTDPFGGPLRDDAAAAVDDLLAARKAAGTLPFPVLTPCGRDELGTPADPARCSAFAFYLSAGLRGAARGYNPENVADEHVTVGELSRFVAARVARYARVVHDRRQTPQLHAPGGPAGDFILTYKPLEPPADSDPPAPYPPWLREAWKVRDAARAAGAGGGLPAAYARLTAGLTRAETEWRLAAGAGRATRADGEWERAKTAWDTALRSSGRPDPAAELFRRAADAAGQFRLAADRAGKPDPSRDWGAALDLYLAAKTATPPKPDAATLRQAWLDKAKTDPPAAAWLVWGRAKAGAAQTRAQFLAWAEAVDEVDLRPPHGAYAETLLLRAVAGYDFRAKRALSRFPGAAVGALLRAEHELGLAVAAGADGFPLARKTFDAAEESRKAAQAALFESEAGGGAVEDMKRSAAASDEAAGGFARARESLLRWQEANRTLEASAATVLDTLPAAVRWNRPAFADWRAAADAATALATKLGRAGREQGFDPAGVSAEVRSTAVTAAKLREPFTPPAIHKVVRESGPRTKAADLVPLDQLVAGLVVPAEVRQTVWDELHAETRRLHDSVLALDAADDAAHAQTALATSPAGPNGEAERVAWRAAASVALLRLAGYEQAEALEHSLRRLTADPGSADAAQTLADRLRKAWHADIPAQAGAASAAGKWPVVARIERAVPSAVAGGLDPAARPAAARAAADDDKEFRTWVRGQLDGDQKYRSAAAGADSFYPSVGELTPN